MKNKIRVIYAILFMAVCVIPVGLMPFVSTDTSKENRELSDMPEFVTEDGDVNLEWSTEFETYLSEHFAFRETLVTANSLIQYGLFATSSEDTVVVGNDGWLYLTECVEDYTGSDIMSDRRVYNTTKTLSLIQEYVENKGGEFVFITAPDKTTVYPEHLPVRYVKSDVTNRSLIYDSNERYGVSQIDLVELFNSQDETLYLTRDTHWTNQGAVLVYNTLMDYFSVEHYDYSSTPYTSQQVWSGDLDTLLFPSLDLLSEQIVYDYDFTFEYTYNFQSEDDLTISTQNDSGEVSVLMYRDSFGRSLYPFISECASEAKFLRETPYRLDALDDFEADITILEIVERNLPDITESAPFMAAPSRSLNTSAAVEKSDENTCFIDEKRGYIRIYGSLDETYFTDESDIYVTLENDSSVLCYEAFPIYEADLLEDENQSDYGYSLYVDPTAVPDGSYYVNVYIKNGDSYVCTDALTEITVSNE